MSRAAEPGSAVRQADAGAAAAVALLQHLARAPTRRPGQDHGGG